MVDPLPVVGAHRAIHLRVDNARSENRTELSAIPLGRPHARDDTLCLCAGGRADAPCQLVTGHLTQAEEEVPLHPRALAGNAIVRPRSRGRVSD